MSSRDREIVRDIESSRYWSLKISEKCTAAFLKIFSSKNHLIYSFFFISKKKKVLLKAHPRVWLWQFLTVQRPLKMVANAFSFILKALFVLEIYRFLFWLFVFVEKRLDKKAMVNIKIYEVTDWRRNTDWARSNYNTHVPKISRSKGN